MTKMSNPTRTAIQFTTYTAKDAKGYVWGVGRTAQDARLDARRRMNVEGVKGATMKALALTITDDACPKCGSTKDTHEGNGVASTAYDYTLCCTQCSHQWSPNEG